MRMLSSLYLGLSVSSAADTVCDEDEQSLLQARAQVRLDVANSRPDPALLLDSAKVLARQMQHESPDAVNAFLASARSALSQMTPQLNEEHRSAQHQIDQQLADIQACGNSASHGTSVTSDLGGRLDTMNDTMNQCMAEKAAAIEDQQQKCNDWQDHATRVTFPTSDLPSSQTADEVYQHTLRLQGWVQDQAATIVAQRNACDAATSHAVAETERCGPVIEEYDQIFCEHQISCLFLSSCHNHELERYDTMRTESEGAENARKAQYTMIEQVGCILGLITDAVNANATVAESSLSTCDGDTTDVEHLTLSFPDAGSALSCPGHQEGDPECPEVNVPTLWENGGEAQGPQPLWLTVSGTANSQACFTDDEPCYSLEQVESGVMIFTDQSSRINSFSEELEGATFVKASIYAFYQTNTQMTVHIERPAMLYTLGTFGGYGGFDRHVPNDGWENIGACMGISDRMRIQCWRKQIDAGDTEFRISSSLIGIVMVRPI